VLVCLAVGLIFAGDPLMPVEMAGAAVLAAWLLEILGAGYRGHRLERSIGAVSRQAVVAGVPCRVMRDSGCSAFVLGTLRPRIYLGARLLTTLDTDEVRAVVLHEEHHRRTRAPLRIAALGAWRRLASSSERVRDALDARVAQLECDADRFALRHGVSRGAIAGALLKTEPSAMGLGFAAQAQARVDHLLHPDIDRRRGHAHAMPFEWAPVVVALAITVFCHALL
jgi:hypothetical protein